MAPDLLELEIQAQHVIPAKLAPYRPLPGDEKVPGGRILLLRRGGQEIGFLIGPGRDHLETFERLEGDPLQTEFADWTGSFRIDGKPPVAVYRKSKPSDWDQRSRQFAITHRLYLRLASPLPEGVSVPILVGNLNVSKPTYTFQNVPQKTLSEAVHVNQIGFRPDDPVKKAYVSCWLGTGGAQHYAEGLRFRVLDVKTGNTAFRGVSGPVWGLKKPERMFREENFNKTDVVPLDFSRLTRPGRYRVCVDGIGSSLPFEIAGDVWTRAVRLQLHGLYNERGGIELRPPFADFTKPPDFIPGKNVKVTQTTWLVLDKDEAFEELPTHDTGRPVPEAWGGYHDAGDWNPRRVTHLTVTMAQLEMLELFPKVFEPLNLHLPDAGNTPDVMKEALFELDCFRRLQKPDGGVPYGIETPGDPIEGEVSWLQSMPAYVYAPDPFSSWTYASCAARASRLLAKYDPSLSNVYRKSALRAMTWAESAYPRFRNKIRWDRRDARNLAALEMYRLTSGPAWHKLFLEDSLLKEENVNLFQWERGVQVDAAFAYARLPKGLGDERLKARAVRGIRKLATAALEYQRGNAFGITNPIRERPMFLGFYSEPGAVELCRAHYLTHEPEYLAGAVQACLFPAGANPNNITYTTGLGANPVRHPLHVDTRLSGQPAPTGLTVYGNIDYVYAKENGGFAPMKDYIDKACTPSAYSWPIPEAYFDVYMYPLMTEFTVDMWAPNVYIWGYLAGR